jgi:hypothetical protein
MTRECETWPDKRMKLTLPSQVSGRGFPVIARVDENLVIQHKPKRGVFAIRWSTPRLFSCSFSLGVES